jgi:starvation-inducible DNA-binding protein
MNTRPENIESPAILQLKRILADTFVLYMKTYAVHWNYHGPRFFSVHKMTEAHYQELAESIDEIAERIRALDGVAPFSLHEVLNSADLAEANKKALSGGDDGIADLAKTHMMLARRAKEAIAVMEKDNDVFSVDMMTARIGSHEKAAWMLKSIL